LFLINFYITYFLYYLMVYTHVCIYIYIYIYIKFLSWHVSYPLVVWPILDLQNVSMWMWTCLPFEGLLICNCKLVLIMNGVISCEHFYSSKGITWFYLTCKQCEKKNCFLYNRYVNISQYGHDGFYVPSVFYKTFTIWASDVSCTTETEVLYHAHS